MRISGKMLTQHAVVYRASYTKDAEGTPERVLTSRIASLRCFVTQVSASKQVSPNKDTVIATARLFCNLGVGIKSSDTIYVVETDTWYQVLTLNPCSGLGHQEVELEVVGEQEVTV